MKAQKYMLCLDNGLSLGKAALVDFEGKIAEIVSFNTEVMNDRKHNEIDMDLLSEKTIDSIKELIKSNGVDPEEIIGLANSGHGGGIYLVDDSGRPVRNAITSMDSRAELLVNKWRNAGVDCYKKTYTNMWNGQAIPLLYWIKKNEKDSFNRTARILFCKDWIKFKLTGEISTDYTDASNSGLIDLNIRDYDPGIYKDYSLDDIYEKLPQLKKSDEIIGYINEEAAAKTGLKKGTPVIGGLVDFIACLIGSGLNDTDTYSVVAGTWGINTAIKNDLDIGSNIMATVLFPYGDSFLAMETSPNSAVNLEWFLSEVIEKSGCCSLDRGKMYEKIDLEVSKIDIGESDAFYFPFIYRSKLSKKMEGVLYGFNASYNLWNLIYSIYEGVVFSHLMHINNLKIGGVDCNKLVLSGGASNSKTWCQMFSDILNMEVITTDSKEAGILGLAIYLAMGLGLYKDLKKAIDSMVRVKAVYKPDLKKHNIYIKRFSKFKKIKELLDQ